MRQEMQGSIQDKPAASTREEDFNALALELFALQFDAVPAYREFCKRRRRVPESVPHWSEIPTVSTNAFKTLPITSLPSAERETAFHSSGTTSNDQSVHWHDAESLRLYEEACRLWFRPHMLPETVGENRQWEMAAWQERSGIPILLLMPDQGSAPHSSLVRMVESIRQSWGAPDSIATGYVDETGLWNIDCGKTVEFLRAAETTGESTMILATAFSLVQLVDHLSETKQRIALPIGSRIMETGGYKGRVRNLSKQVFYRAIHRLLGVEESRIICEYGMSELSAQAYDHVAGTTPPPLSERLFQWPPWARARIVSPETGGPSPHGETGLVEVFDLANVRSVMAIQTQDIGAMEEKGMRLSGRASDAEPKGCSLMSP